MTSSLDSSSIADDSAPTHLQGSTGVWGLVFMVVAGAAPLGVIGGTVPIAMDLGNGVGLPAMMLAGTVILLLFSAGFTALGPYVQNAGAFYSYIGKGLGRKVGYGVAAVALVAYMSLVVGLYGLMASGAVSLFDSWGIPIHWAFFAIAAWALIAFLGYRNIDLSVRVLGVLLMAELLIVLVFDAAVMIKGGGPDGMSTAFLHPSTVTSGAPGLALLFVFLSFLGFEATAVFRDEVRDPIRTVPRATYLAVSIIGVFYFVSTWFLISAFGDAGAAAAATNEPGTMLPHAILIYLGTTAEHIVQILYVTSLIACLITFHNVVARYAFTLSNRRALPKIFGRAHVRHGSPHMGSVAVTVVGFAFIVGAAVLGLDPALQLYTWFAGYTTVGFILLLLLTTISVLAFFGRQWRSGNLEHGVGRVLVAPAIALAGLLAVSFLVVQNLPILVGSKSIAIVVLGFLALTLVSGFYYAARRPHLTLD